MQFFSIENDAKTIKGRDLGYRTAIQYWQSADKSGYNVCRHATTCRDNCIEVTGRGVFPNVKKARHERTVMFFEDRSNYERMVVKEIERHIRLSEKHGYTPCARPNGTSDIPWERVRFKTQKNRTLMELFPDLIWYDYTKYPYKSRPAEKLPSNYSLTFSVSELTTDEDIHENINMGRNCAVVFDVEKEEKLPATYLGIEVIDGDLNDLRFTDPIGVIVGLRLKGNDTRLKNTTIESGFVRK